MLKGECNWRRVRVRNRERANERTRERVERMRPGCHKGHVAQKQHIHIERAQCVAHIELQLLTFTLSVLNLSNYNL